jgi:hypothetical protein
MEAARRESEVLARLQKDLRNKRLAIIVGAGVTLSATADASGKPLSRIIWTGLIQNGLDFLVSNGYVDRLNRRIKRAYEALEDPDIDGWLEDPGIDGSLDDPDIDGSLDDPDIDGSLDAANILSSQLREHGQFPTWLQSVFGSLYQDVRHPAILEVLKNLHENGAVLLTTNYDDILETYCGLGHIGRSKADDIVNFRRGNMDGVFHVHGNYHDPQEIILDTTDYYQINHSDEVQNMLKAFLDDKTILFVGCGSRLEDPNFNELLKWGAKQQKNIPNKHCLLIRDGDSLSCNPLIRIKYGPNYHDLALYLSKLLHNRQAGK